MSLGNGHVKAATETTFQPEDFTSSKPFIQLPDELWLTVLSSPCTFSSDIFCDVMLNLINNPNVTSSYLFRADIYYDSDKDFDLRRTSAGRIESSLLAQMRAEYRPLPFALEGYQVTRTLVRKLIPRNPQLDNALVQTCHFLSRTDDQEEVTMVIYMPHAQDPERMPFYHPAVSRVAFCHRWKSCLSDTDIGKVAGSISLSYCLFPGTVLNIKLERTALRLLQTAHKHGQGRLAGYEKRVHLDQIIPQRRYQDTYTRLKAKYGKYLAERWVEVTDPGKHVFEDIGIAAFLVELWRDMYSYPTSENQQEGNKDGGAAVVKPPFPGFVDIGCGNGILVYILLAEGYKGWGFDARNRKTWEIFPPEIRQNLCRRILVPRGYQEAREGHPDSLWHDGVFEPGTFIISNHADELTLWTPLLAYVNRSAFVAIPCCSHDFTGARFRAPASVKGGLKSGNRLPQQQEALQPEQRVNTSQIAETGSLRKSVAQQKMQSAYSTLCSYVTSVADELGYKIEREVLRIPSTRNQCVLGRQRRAEQSAGHVLENEGSQRWQHAIEIVERETKMSIQAASSGWIERVEKLSAKPGSGH